MRSQEFLRQLIIIDPFFLGGGFILGCNWHVLAAPYPLCGTVSFSHPRWSRQEVWDPVQLRSEIFRTLEAL